MTNNNATKTKIDQKMSRGFDIDVVRRRKWWIVIPFLVSMGISIGLIAYLPKIYRSSTTVLVESQKIPEEYVKSTISGSIEDRLGTIRQEILSRSRLQKIIDEFDLYKKEFRWMTKEAVIDLMIKRIDIRTIGNKKIVDAFTISFDGEDPVVAMNVANKLASLFIEENLNTREQLIEGASEFLENELESIRQVLEKKEEEIREYKKRHIGELPEQLEANLRTLDRYQMEFQSVVVALKVAEERKTNLEKMLSDRNQANGGNILPAQDTIVPLDPDYARLARLKQEIEELRMEYREAHPDVMALNRQIKELEESLSKKSSMKEDIKVVGAEEKKGKSISIIPSQEMAFYHDLQRQHQEASLEVRSLRERLGEVQKQIRLYERRVENAPEGEQQMTTLMRDYENTKKNYQSLLDKKLNARISENLERKQKGEQFKILDPANLPEKPFKPDPIRLLGLGLAGWLGIAIILVSLIESLDTSFKKSEEVEDALGFPVLVSIPLFSQKRTKMVILEPSRHNDTVAFVTSERIKED